ncbi:thiopeptide-type bacteriocin biosynthesis protein [Duganella sp. HSC-15S17]|uniref:Thiopeptide-type bacteriocin biosynthesis protein n=1 Tax=Duganella violaceipulchra TaxID=2849652 RepID=A0ABT1GI74_9BURK|nr:thiopeptide-type bacteriocin biosynthesis protein [Duganella violaceicalia]
MKQNTFTHGGHLAIRAPARNAAAWHNYIASSKDAIGNSSLQRRADAACRIFQDMAVQEAIWLASAGLLERLGKWDWIVRDDDDKKLLSAFDRYYNRMCFRATPFGTFSSFSFAKLRSGHDDPAFSAGLLGDIALRRVFTLDAELAFHLLHHAVSLAPRVLRYSVNASLYKRGDMFRFVDWRQGRFGSRSYTVSEVQWTEELAQVLVARGRGPFTYDQLLDSLATAADCSVEESHELISSLCQWQVLLPCPGLNFFGGDASAVLCQALPRVPALAGLVEKVEAELHALARQPCAQPVPVQVFREANQRFRQLYPDGFKTNSCIQADSFRPLPQDHLDDGEFVSLAERAGDLFSRFGYRINGLDRFTEHFRQRYENEFIRLVDVLDDEALTEAFDFDAQRTDQVTELDRILIKKMLDATPGQTIRLSYADIAAVAPSRHAAAVSDPFAIVEKIDHSGNGAGICFELQDILSTHSIDWLARFAHGDEAVAALMAGVAKEVERRDPLVVHAEVAYMPVARLGNIMRRPLIWSHVLDLVEQTEHDGALPISDLWLGATPDGLELWSQSLQRPVQPHVTSAHNARHPGNTNLYRFLRAFERQNQWQFRLVPSSAFAGLDGMPRVEYEGIVVYPANWVIRSESLERNRDLAALLRQRNVPRWVRMTEFDNTLVLDTEDEFDVAQMARSLKTNGSLFLREYFAPHAPLSVNHELLLPLRRRVPLPAARPVRTDFPQVAAYQMADGFMRQVPHSAMIYVKLYMAPGAFDAFLEQIYTGLMRDADLATRLRGWFFIRYADPDHHIRLRLASDDASYGFVMERLMAWLTPYWRQRVVDTYRFDLYTPEYARYKGPRLTALSERLFGQDSILACQVLKVRNEQAGAFATLHSLIFAVDRLLADAGLDYRASHALLASLAQGFSHEFGVDKKRHAGMGMAFRKEAGNIENILLGNDQSLPWLGALDAFWRDQRHQRVGLMRECRRQLVSQGESWEANEFLKSHVHMSCNRLVSGSRPWELRLYHYLAKAYHSFNARGIERKNSPKHIEP